MEIGIAYYALILFVSFFTLLALGVPVAFCIIVATAIALAIDMPIQEVFYMGSQTMFEGINSFGLLAVPFFILSGSLMNHGGIAKRLIDLALLIGGRIPGSLLHANVLSNMLFGSVSGSSVAAASAVGGFMGPLQKEKNYDKNICAAVNIASAPTGLLIPPTGMFIIYSLLTGASVGTLFIAAYIPGIMMGLGVMLVAYYFAKKYNYPVEPRKESKEVVNIILSSIPSLAMVVLVIGGIVFGVFTATEGGAIAVAYSAILALIYKEISVKEFPKICLDAAAMSGLILFLIAASSFMAWVMSYLSLPEALSDLLIGISENKLVIFLLMNLALLLVGTFLDVAPALLIFTPIFFPVAHSLGMGDIQFGIMIAFNLCIGNFTPPVGSALFVGCNVAGVPIEKVIKPLIPIFLLEILLLLMVTYIPNISLILPKIFGLI
ncbi:TRAP transporter large permease [Chromohalobacter beijerinckii]|uniref:TRAP transporter large permease protein n=1 Tax=Chromohalobacter beijerinckii TaxID=86179 RepID=A0ABV8XB29_9GAMM|nr:TRAP transporter large permease [Chromohalobacter beijerinckii]MCK0766792.1 TRAP transporter large permease [Chromohalobacter beijerinckii]